jgi:hypothetical protein
MTSPIESSVTGCGRRDAPRTIEFIRKKAGTRLVLLPARRRGDQTRPAPEPLQDVFAEGSRCATSGPDFGDGTMVWQADVAIFHRITNDWRFVWEFDETNAREAGRHGIPPRVFRALVNRQLFGH